MAESWILPVANDLVLQVSVGLEAKWGWECQHSSAFSVLCFSVVEFPIPCLSVITKFLHFWSSCFYPIPYRIVFSWTTTPRGWFFLRPNSWCVKWAVSQSKNDARSRNLWTRLQHRLVLLFLLLNKMSNLQCLQQRKESPSQEF